MAQHFLQRLRAHPNDEAGRRWAYIPYDQLSGDIGLLAECQARDVGIVLVESVWKPNQRPYHKQKLALLLASQRHFALEQAERGVAIRYLMGSGDYASQLDAVVETLGPLVVMEPAERELRVQLQPLVDAGRLVVRPHDGWLTTPADFKAAMQGKARWRMDTFYRFIRKRYGWLLDDHGKPVGGKWRHDADNRQPWHGDPVAPDPPRFDVDDITAEVVAMIETTFADHPGRIQGDRIPATLADVEAVWRWTKERCMEHFGPYEDAMTTRSVQLFHGRLSGLLNLHRLSPRRVVEEVLAMDLPINSKEGFVRQVTGWREFVRHVHQQTDGFRILPDGITATTLAANRPVPDVYWEGGSGLHCLDHVVTEVWTEAYSHHINRLMVLANWGTLLGISPQALSDWFWVAFEDAYDWVVEPNVIGMGTYGVGELMVTKPYVSGSAYINKMSDYCGQCAFNPKTNCPMTHLYWNFLARNKDALADNPRMRIVMASLRRRAPERVATDERIFQHVVEALEEGRSLHPDDLVGSDEAAK